MKNQSLTITGVFIALLSWAAQQYNLSISHNEIVDIVTAASLIFGICTSWYGRVRLKDVNLLGKRKSSTI